MSKSRSGWGAGIPLRLRNRVAAVPLLFLLSVILSPAAETPCVWTGVQKIVAVGDLHGDWDHCVLILQNNQIVDQDLRWAAGKTHLVQTGDIMDRGDGAKKILDLFRRLEEEAAAAGGMVHVLLGNHEEMNITGISLDYPNYVTIAQFLSFLPDGFRKAKEEEYVLSLPRDRQRQARDQGLDLSSDKGLQLYWQTLLRRDSDARDAYKNGFNDRYGKWLLKQNTVIKINDIIFVHGGISKTYSSWPLEKINSLMRSELGYFRDRLRGGERPTREFKPKLVYNPDGPLWYRGLASLDENGAQAEVDGILANLAARAIVIGHNYGQLNGGSPIVSLDSISRFKGKVFIIDTGIAEFYGGLPAALIIEDGRFTLWGQSEEVTAREMDQPPPQDKPAGQDLEKTLRSATIVDRKAGAAGRTDPWKITLEEDGVVYQAMFKYIDRPRPDLLPDSFRYELAAYRLNKELGLSFVPPAAEREIEGVAGSLQIFLEGIITGAEMKSKKIQPADPEAFARSRDDLRVFLSLIYESCENEKDTLIHREDWSLHRVDFGQAFAPKSEAMPGCEIRRCSRILYQNLLAWDEKKVSGLLAGYLNHDELRALHARRDIIIRILKDLIQAKGESDVLF